MINDGKLVLDSTYERDIKTDVESTDPCFSNLECSRQAFIYDQDFPSGHKYLHNIL